MIPALTIEARAGVVVVTMTADAAHVIGCLLSEGVDTWPEAAAALVAASNHASYTVPAHFVPREGSAPLPRPDDYWSTSDARYGIGDGPRMTVPETGPAIVHAPEGVAA